MRGGKNHDSWDIKKIKHKSMDYHKTDKAESKEQHEVAALTMNGRC